MAIEARPALFRLDAQNPRPVDFAPRWQLSRIFSETCNLPPRLYSKTVHVVRSRRIPLWSDRRTLPETEQKVHLDESTSRKAELGEFPVHAREVPLARS